MDRLDRIQRRLAPLRAALIEHPVYRQIGDLAGLQRFMELHVFAVWDFMSLLKALQLRLSWVSVPWVPPADLASARLVNEIVLAEETDSDGRGGHASHFDLYHESMTEAGAGTDRIDALVRELRSGQPLGEALDASQVPLPARKFVETTFAFIDSGELPAIASAFTFGREDLLPAVFRRIVAEAGAHSPGRLDRFLYYLDRHIELDGDEHGPMAHQLVLRICDSDEANWDQAEQAAVRSLEARLELWNGMSREIGSAAPPR